MRPICSSITVGTDWMTPSVVRLPVMIDMEILYRITQGTSALFVSENFPDRFSSACTEVNTDHSRVQRSHTLGGNRGRRTVGLRSLERIFFFRLAHACVEGPASGDEAYYFLALQSQLLFFFSFSLRIYDDRRLSIFRRHAGLYCYFTPFYEPLSLLPWDCRYSRSHVTRSSFP